MDNLPFKSPKARIPMGDTSGDLVEISVKGMVLIPISYFIFTGNNQCILTCGCLLCFDAVLLIDGNVGREKLFHIRKLGIKSVTDNM